MPTSPILVLDDNESDRLLIRQALLPSAPRRPLVDFGDAAGALTWLRKQAQRGPWQGTILLDWRLDPGCGSDVLAVVRAEPALAGAEVIILSGADSPIEQRKAFEAGADHWEIKPPDWRGYEQLARKIGAGRGVAARGCGSGAGAKGELALLPAGVAVGSYTMHASTTVVPHLMIAQMEAAAQADASVGQMFRQALGFLTAVYAQTVDREEAEIKAVCDRHRIRVRLARGHSRDQMVEAKRAAVLRDLIRLGWDDPTLIDHFECSKATLERRRSEVRESGEGVVMSALAVRG